MRAGIALLPVAAVCALLTLYSPAQTQSPPNPRHWRVSRKLQHLQSNAAVKQPDSTPTEFSEQEINAYFASGNIKLPNGVKSVVFQTQPQIVIGTSRVDFDQLTSGKNSYNPLLSVFSGVHEVVVAAHAHGAKGEGFVHVDRFPSTAWRFPSSFWNCSSRNTSSRNTRTSASIHGLTCRPAWTRRRSLCRKSLSSRNDTPSQEKQ